jgi:DNA processing protein
MGQRGYGVISGLARGIDTAAHEGSVATGTLAVIAGGVDKIYPPENRNLYHQIAEQGLLVAESPLGMDPHATLFPRRNRLISALSCGVLVIEAALHSGSLITAKYAASQGKDVFVVPGSPLDARYQGSLQLLKQGCVLTTGPSDIFDVLERNYALTFHESSQAYDASLYEAAEDMQAGEDVVKGKILEALSFTPTLMDDVMRAVPANANQVLAQVLELELAGLVMRHPGNLIARTV